MFLSLAMMGDTADTLAKLFKPWSSLYSDSKAVSATVLFLHLAPLVFAAGAAFMMDRATIRASHGGLNARAAHLRDLRLIHRLVLQGLGLSFVTGALLFMADVETFIASPFFYTKLGCVTLLLVNGYLLQHTERTLTRWGDKDSLWNRMRRLAYSSIVLWFVTVLAGVVLTAYA